MLWRMGRDAHVWESYLGPDTIDLIFEAKAREGWPHWEAISISIVAEVMSIGDIARDNV